MTSARIDSCPPSARQGRGWISISATAHVSARMLDRLAAAAQLADAVLAKVGPGFAVGGDRDDATMLEVVREPAEAVTEFILDPTPARRSDRVGDVAHSRSAAPWRDLERAPRLAGERGGAGGAEGSGTGRDRAVQPSR